MYAEPQASTQWDFSFFAFKYKTQYNICKINLNHNLTIIMNL